MSFSLYEHLKRDIKKMVSGVGKNEKGNIYPLIIQEVEASVISLVLEETKYNYLKAARILGISRSTLYQKISVLKIKTKLQAKQGGMEDDSSDLRKDEISKKQETKIDYP